VLGSTARWTFAPVLFLHFSCFSCAGGRRAVNGVQLSRVFEEFS
jgi:hypothetical protein